MANILSMADRNKFIERMIGYEFSDTSIIYTALHTAGSSVGSEGNKSLAMVGDAVLRLVLIVHGYNKHVSRGKRERERERRLDILKLRPNF